MLQYSELAARASLPIRPKIRYLLRKLLMLSLPDLMPSPLWRLYILYEFVMLFDVKQLRYHCGQVVSEAKNILSLQKVDGDGALGFNF